MTDNTAEQHNIPIPVFDGKHENFPPYICALKNHLHNHSIKELQEFDNHDKNITSKNNSILFNIIINSLNDTTKAMVNVTYDDFNGKELYKSLLEVYTISYIQRDAIKRDIDNMIQQIPTHYNFNFPQFFVDIDKKFNMLVFEGMDMNKYGYSLAINIAQYSRSERFYHNIIKEFTQLGEEKFVWKDFKKELLKQYNLEAYENQNNNNFNNYSNNRRINNINTNQSPWHQYHNNSKRNYRRNNSFHNYKTNFRQQSIYHNKRNYNNSNASQNDNNSVQNNINQNSAFSQPSEKICKTCQLHGLPHNNHNDLNCRWLSPNLKYKIKYNKNNFQQSKSINIIQTDSPSYYDATVDPHLPSIANMDANAVNLNHNGPTINQRLSYPPNDQRS